MAVDFNGVNSNALNPQKQTARQRSDSSADGATGKSSGAAEQQPSNSTNVNLSRDAQSIKAAESALQEQPNVDDSRVDSIRQALEDGSFQIDADELAQKMLNVDESIFG